MKFKTYDDFYRHSIIGLYVMAIVSLTLFIIVGQALVVIPVVILTSLFIALDYINYILNNLEETKEVNKLKLKDVITLTTIVTIALISLIVLIYIF